MENKTLYNSPRNININLIILSCSMVISLALPRPLFAVRAHKDPLRMLVSRALIEGIIHRTRCHYWLYSYALQKQFVNQSGLWFVFQYFYSPQRSSSQLPGSAQAKNYRFNFVGSILCMGTWFKIFSDFLGSSFSVFTNSNHKSSIWQLRDCSGSAAVTKE